MVTVRKQMISALAQAGPHIMVILKINASHEKDMKARALFCCCLQDKNNKTPWSFMLVGNAPVVSVSAFEEVFGAGLHFRRYVRSPSPQSVGFAVHL